MSDAADLIVVGSGPGGYIAAIRASQLGLRTIVVERESVGGRCLNEACIPAKAMLHVADRWADAQDGARFGIEAERLTLSFAAARGHQSSVVERLSGGVRTLLEKNEVELVEGTATLTADRTVRVAERELSAPQVILACGSVATPVLGLEFGERVIDTAAAWRVESLPGRLCVIGAGASGTEIASAYSRLGSEVTLLEAADQILPLEEPEAAAAVQRALESQGVDVIAGAEITRVTPGEDQVAIETNAHEISCDVVCLAAGRAPDVERLGLDEAGIERDERGLIAVDGLGRTSREGVWAIGDLVAGPALAHKASEQGVIAAEDAAGVPAHPIGLGSIPGVTFTAPQVASFGPREARAREENDDLTIVHIPLHAVGAPVVYNDGHGFVKLVAGPDGAILGATVVGARAGELIQELKVAQDFEAGVADVARSVHPHPTYAEAILEAARAADGWLIHG